MRTFHAHPCGQSPHRGAAGAPQQLRTDIQALLLHEGSAPRGTPRAGCAREEQHLCPLQKNKQRRFTPDGEIDYPRIVVSKGSVRKASITSVTVADGLLTVIFDGYVYGGAATDMFFLFVYSPAHCAGILADPVPRSAGHITVDLPDEWLQTAAANASDNTNTLTHSHNQSFHLYAFLQGYRLRTSDTIYCMLQ